MHIASIGKNVNEWGFENYTEKVSMTQFGYNIVTCLDKLRNITKRVRMSGYLAEIKRRISHFRNRRANISISNFGACPKHTYLVHLCACVCVFVCTHVPAYI